ncbi:hypothetical protein VNO80_25488 [Phaseolus coccineus]|uniref:Uncharacterized protein n=1 Tax=Phaseolus coccineus TaxID=3886 RepID=A0AAN9LZK6_PHACN
MMQYQCQWLLLSGQLLLRKPVMVKPSEVEKNLVQSNASSVAAGVASPYGAVGKKLYRLAGDNISASMGMPIVNGSVPAQQAVSLPIGAPVLSGQVMPTLVVEPVGSPRKRAREWVGDEEATAEREAPSIYNL